MNAFFFLLSFLSFVLAITMTGAVLWFIATIAPLLRRWLERELAEQHPIR